MKKLHMLFILIFAISHLTLLAQQTLILQPGTEGKDAIVRSNYPYLNIGNEPDYIANAFTAQGDFFILRGFLQFDLSVLPSNAEITNAKLSLYCNTESGHHQLQYGDNQCYLRRIVDNWDESTINWSNQPNATTDNQVIIPTSSSQTQDYPDIDVTQLVMEMFANPLQGYGFLLQLVTEDTYRTMAFASGDHPNSRKWPKLEITYTDCDMPIASFSYIVNVLDVDFNNQSSDATTFYWDFGDGYFSNLPNPLHAYQNQGIYHVCLIASNECGSDTICQDISLCKTLTCSFSYDNSNDRLLVFTDSSVNSETWFWDFGDNFYSDLQSPTHYYNNYGTYNVCLLTTNECYTETYCTSVVVGPNSVEEILKGKVVVFPNPSSVGFTIEIPVSAVNSEVKVIDMTGRLVYHSSYDPGSKSILIPALKPGIYSLLIDNESNKWQIKLISY